ncbi:RnfABCDGE type electron transport complex subunit D [bacterium]|nr:RnfABCDGE type electron transport complex subunit D [bacterium]
MEEKEIARAEKPSIIRPPEYQVASSPHQHSGASIHSIMWTVFAALLPAAAVGTYYFGWAGLKVLVVCTAAAMIVEALYQKVTGQEITVSDGSAAVTGLLLGMNLPPATPAWMVVVGAFVAVFIGKQVFGGLGYNPFNPALVSRVFLLISFPVQMTTWSRPAPFFSSGTDAVTAASPLGEVKMELLTKGTALAAQKLTLVDALMGNIPGSAGETSALALLLGGLFLIRRKIITWHIPFSFLVTVAAISALCNALDPSRYPGPSFNLLTGGLIIGAFFMATDYVTSPVSPKGMLIFGFGCGFLTMAIRYWGGYPEGVSFAILLMNMCVPLIDTYMQPRVFGEEKSRA